MLIKKQIPLQKTSVLTHPRPTESESLILFLIGTLGDSCGQAWVK